ncbi:MAG TPA: hypothetical protein PLN06_09685 [Bacteroidales bacterium]|nr:hypothetical protein [Bacteroidales bacterium]HOU96872.1 hypothetical protein [Bacteroidales bacterium]
MKPLPTSPNGEEQQGATEISPPAGGLRGQIKAEGDLGSRFDLINSYTSDKTKDKRQKVQDIKKNYHKNQPY